MGSVEICNAVTLSAGRSDHSSDGDAAADVGDGYGDGWGAAEGGGVFGVCEGCATGQTAAALGVAGKDEKIVIADMRNLHATWASDKGWTISTSEVDHGAMPEEHALLLRLADRYVKSGGPPARPPGWLQPPAQQSDGIALSAPRKWRARTDQGPEAQLGPLLPPWAVDAARQGASA